MILSCLGLTGLIINFPTNPNKTKPNKTIPNWAKLRPHVTDLSCAEFVILTLNWLPNPRQPKLGSGLLSRQAMGSLLDASSRHTAQQTAGDFLQQQIHVQYLFGSMYATLESLAPPVAPVRRRGSRVSMCCSRIDNKSVLSFTHAFRI